MIKGMLLGGFSQATHDLKANGEALSPNPVLTR